MNAQGEGKTGRWKFPRSYLIPGFTCFGFPTGKIQPVKKLYFFKLKLMKKRIVQGVLLFLFAILLAFSAPEPGTPVIYMIGDSTMANKTPERHPETGWGMVLPKLFTDKVKIENHAVNGRSTKSFISEGRWQAVLGKLNKGDYVFIQFGHNDQKVKDSARFTNPYTGFRHNLYRFVNETRQKGAIPVLFTSVARRNFNESGTLADTHGEYTEVTRTVAKELEVPMIDLDFLTEQRIAILGPEKSKELFLWLAPGENPNYPDGVQDNTHFNEKGAMEVALMAAGGLKELNLEIARYLK